MLILKLRVHKDYHPYSKGETALNEILPDRSTKHLYIFVVWDRHNLVASMLWLLAQLVMVVLVESVADLVWMKSSKVVAQD